MTVRQPSLSKGTHCINNNVAGSGLVIGLGVVTGRRGSSSCSSPSACCFLPSRSLRSHSCKPSSSAPADEDQSRENAVARPINIALWA